MLFKKISVLSCLLFVCVLHAHSDYKQLPEDDYLYQGNINLGFDQYKTTSLNGEKKVVLTFDDGPHPTRTPRTLDLLKRYGVKATFFVLTDKINDSNKKILKRIVDEGHILSTHGSNHKNANNMNESEFYYNLKSSVVTLADILKEFGSDQKGLYYRFPYGAYGKTQGYHHFNVIKEISQEVYGENCIHFSFWDIDSVDWAPELDAEEIAESMMAHLVGGTAYTVEIKRTIFGNTRYKVKDYRIRTPRGGGVILLHDIHERSIRATEAFLQKALQSGVEVVPLSEVQEYGMGGRDCSL
jgi:peptidoglycan/xylan/chitin deacetylase (PgdA/CDA1 family)